MRFSTEVTPEDHPDVVGEVLRSSFFDEKVLPPSPIELRLGIRKPHTEVGCYSTFDWQKDVTPLPDLPVEEHNHPPGKEPEDDVCWACSQPEKWTRGKKVFAGIEIECRYYWDGDGVLAFVFPDGSWLTNDDCKKDHGWEFHRSCPY